MIFGPWRRHAVLTARRSAIHRRQLVPVQGLNAMTTSYYLNHAEARSGKTNMQPRECNCPVMCFFATRDIRAGEELLFDYVNAFGEGALEQGVFEQIKSAG